MVSTISNIEQSKRIVDASRKNIHKRNSLDGCSIPKKGQSKHTCFRHKSFHLLGPVRRVQRIEILSQNVVPVGRLVIWTESSPNLDYLGSLGSVAKEKGRQWLWRKSAIAMFIRPAAFGSTELPHSFICVKPPSDLNFFAWGWKKDDIERAATVLLLRGVLLLKLEVSVTADQACCFLDGEVES